MTTNLDEAIEDIMLLKAENKRLRAAMKEARDRALNLRESEADTPVRLAMDINKILRPFFVSVDD